MLSIQPQNNEYQSFLSWWVWSKNNLKYLLEPNYEFFSKKGLKKSITKLLIRSIEDYYNNKGSGAVDLAHLINLIEDLDYLRIKNNKAFLNYKKTLVSGISNGFDQLTGTWFEIRIARLLTMNDFFFSQPEPPDFSIIINDINIGIECNAPRTEIGSNVKKKIINAVKNKSRKYYGQEWINNPSILFLDATWLIRAEGSDIVKSNNPLTDNIKDGLTEAVSKTTFDLIIAFWFGHATIEQRNQNSMTCVHVSKGILDKSLMIFREKLLTNFGVLENEMIQLPDLFRD